MITAKTTPIESDGDQPSNCLAVVVHHRDQNLLSNCLRSLLASHNGEIDLKTIVVLNGSNAQLPPEVESPDVYVLRLTDPTSFSEANNAGVRWAEKHLGNFEALLFINNDAQLHLNSLEVLLSELRTHPECAITAPRLILEKHPDHLNSLGINVTSIGEAWDEGIGQRLEDYGPLPTESFETLAVTGAAVLVESGFFASIGGWSRLYGYYFEDIDLCLRAWSRGRTVRLVPDAVGCHRVSSTAGLDSDFKLFYSWRNRIVLVLLHWPVLSLLRWFPRLAIGEARDFLLRKKAGAQNDATRQARAWKSTLGLLFPIVHQRLAGRSSTSWTRFLKPPGSVPAIKLPSSDDLAPK